MKKSNIILLSTIIAILALFAIAFINAKNKAEISLKEENETYKSVAILAFSHLVLENSEKTTFIQDSSAYKLSFQMENDSTALDNYYRITNDTLYLKSDKPVKIYGKGIHSIHLKENRELFISDIETDSLQIVSDGGHVHFMSSETENNIESLSLISTNSNLDVYSNIRVKDLNINLKNSSLNIYNGKYQNANIHVQDNSNVNFKNRAETENSAVKKDGTSTVYLK